MFKDDDVKQKPTVLVGANPTDSDQASAHSNQKKQKVASVISDSLTTSNFDFKVSRSGDHKIELPQIVVEE